MIGGGGMMLEYSLPPLPYGFKDLEPVISEKQLRLHYEKHHQGYIENANSFLNGADEARKKNKKFNVGFTAQGLAFNVGGIILHNIFWNSMMSVGRGGGQPEGKFSEAIDRDFGGLEAFRGEFTQAAVSVQGSGWAALTFDGSIDKLLITQIEKHQDNLFPGLPLLMVLDVWEHAYYLDYQNRRKDFIEAWWKIVNWEWTGRRYLAMIG